MTRVYRVDPAAPDPAVIAMAAALLLDGGLVAMPTETVYGLAANALDPVAVRSIFDAKGRPTYNPLIVHLADTDQLPTVAREIPALAYRLAERFWPGPLTLVLKRQPAIPDQITGGSDTLGVRIPDHAVARALIRAAGVPLAAPSANLFTRVSPTTAAHVMEQLGDRVGIVLDAGPSTVGIESTVIDLTRQPPRLLRPGGLARELIEALTGPLGAVPTPRSSDAVRSSPGMIARHYAPRTRLCLFATDAIQAAIGAAAASLASGEASVVIAWSTSTGNPAVWDMPNDPAAYARRLYAVLHDLEDRGIAVAWVEEPPARPGWDAIRDRLTRASTS